MFTRSLVAAAAACLMGCAAPQAARTTTPAAQPATSAAAPSLAQPAAQGSGNLPQRNVTNFSAGLRCMDDLLFRYGVRDVSVMIEEMQDQSRRLGAGTRDMMISAYSEMTRRSRGVRLVTFGQDNQNIVQLMSIAQRLNDFKVVPQYDIRGSITQFDEAVERKDSGFGVALVSAFTGPLLGINLNRSQQTSVMGFDASVVSTADLSLVPGASSKNTISVTQESSGIGDAQAQIRNSSVRLNFSVARNEGVAQALRNVIELSAIELTGKLLRLPYWGCLNIAPDTPEVQREIEDWYLSMQDSPELTRFYQEQLRNRKFYDGPMDGKSNTAYTEALAAHRKAQGVNSEGDIGFETFRAFLMGSVPKAPARPFTAAKATEAQDTAVVTKPVPLSVKLAKTKYRKGDPIELTLSVQEPAYVYCFVQSPATGKIQRIFPNRFMRDPLVQANSPIVLPGNAGFKVPAGGDGARQQAVGCLATQREIYNELPPQLRWGDFEDIRLATFDEVREAFAQVAKAPVAMEGAIIDIASQ